MGRQICSGHSHPRFARRNDCTSGRETQRGTPGVTGWILCAIARRCRCTYSFDRRSTPVSGISPPLHPRSIVYSCRRTTCIFAALAAIEKTVGIQADLFFRSARIRYGRFSGWLHQLWHPLAVAFQQRTNRMEHHLHLRSSILPGADRGHCHCCSEISTARSTGRSAVCGRLSVTRRTSA